MMAMEAMPTPAAVKPLAKREADFSARPSVRFGSFSATILAQAADSRQDWFES